MAPVLISTTATRWLRDPSATNASLAAASNEKPIAPPNISRLALLGGSAGAPPPRPPRPRPPRPAGAAAGAPRPAPPRLTPAYAVSGVPAACVAAGAAATALPISPRYLPSRLKRTTRVSFQPAPPIQKLPFGSIAMRAACTGPWPPPLQPPQWPTSAPDASYSTTGGVGVQHSPVGGFVADPISVRAVK